MASCDLKQYCVVCKKELQKHEQGCEFCFKCMLDYSDFLCGFYKAYETKGQEKVKENEKNN